MNFGEVIQAWKEGFSWIDNSINPYVMRDMTGVMKNPLVPGEVIVTFTILDRTVIVNEEVFQYQTDMEYHTLCLNGTIEEKEREAARLQQELTQFTKAAIAERQKQIDDLRNAGETVMTTNPYAW